MKFEKIYVAIDFKEGTNSIIAHALWLAELAECREICLFHIIEYSFTPPSYLLPYIEREKKRLEKILSDLSQKASINQYFVTYEVIYGRLIESINSLLKDQRVALVIGFKSHITRPSTSERILKGIKVPVLVVKNKEERELSTEKISVNQILCPIDFSENSLRALEVAKELSMSLGAMLTVLHVINEYRVKVVVEDSHALQNFLAMLKEEALEKLANIAKGFKFEVMVGNPAEDIVRKTSEFDLTVIGSKGRSYGSAFLIGSVAEAVIRNSKKNVLLIH